jgi:hypothetical protein
VASLGPTPPPQAQVEVQVNQEGSPGELNLVISDDHVEPGYESQSQDKEDLQIVVPNNSEEMPSCIQPFDSQ